MPNGSATAAWPQNVPLAQPLRRERLIATCRLALAGFGLLALWLDPTDPGELAPLAFGLGLAYCVWSGVVAWYAWRVRALAAPTPMILHGIDFLVLSTIILASQGWAESPFFLSLVFLLAAGTVRWRQAGTLGTALALLGLLLVSAVFTNQLQLDLRDYILRSIQLAVIAVLLGYLGGYEERLRTRIAAMALRTEALPTDLAGRVRSLVEHAAGVLNAQQVVLAWTQSGQPWLNIGAWRGSEFDLWREPREGQATLAPAEFAEKSFLAAARPGGDGRYPLVLASGGASHPEAPWPDWLPARFAARQVMSAPVQGASVTGRLFALDSRESTTDELVLHEMLARQVAARMDQLLLFERLHEGGLAEERVRLARDLHDGVIQSLAAGALRLETARHLLKRSPADAAPAIVDVQELLETEQQELRDIIAALQPGRPVRDGLPLPERLQRLATRMRRHWRLEVELAGADSVLSLPGALVREVCWIVREALVNAVRHGRASTARVVLGMGDGELKIQVADDGGGFGFEGRFDFDTLSRLRLAPYNLAQRVAALGGDLAIESSPAGASLEVSLPCRRPGEVS